MKLKIYVQPNASRSEIVGRHGEDLKVKIKAPPVDGEANQEVIRFFSEILEIPKRHVRLLHGETGRNKLIEIDETEISKAEILKKLNKEKK